MRHGTPGLPGVMGILAGIIGVGVVDDRPVRGMAQWIPIALIILVSLKAVQRVGK